MSSKNIFVLTFLLVSTACTFQMGSEDPPDITVSLFDRDIIDELGFCAPCIFGAGREEHWCYIDQALWCAEFSIGLPDDVAICLICSLYGEDKTGENGCVPTEIEKCELLDENTFEAISCASHTENSPELIECLGEYISEDNIETPRTCEDQCFMDVGPAEQQQCIETHCGEENINVCENDCMERSKDFLRECMLDSQEQCNQRSEDYLSECNSLCIPTPIPA
jgi:hypothetical protein